MSFSSRLIASSNAPIAAVKRRMLMYWRPSRSGHRNSPGSASAFSRSTCSAAFAWPMVPISLPARRMTSGFRASRRRCSSLVRPSRSGRLLPPNRGIGLLLLVSLADDDHGRAQHAVTQAVALLGHADDLALLAFAEGHGLVHRRV